MRTKTSPRFGTYLFVFDLRETDLYKEFLKLINNTIMHSVLTNCMTLFGSRGCLLIPDKEHIKTRVTRYLTIIPRARAGYEMVNSQRGP